MGLVAQRAWQY